MADQLFIMIQDTRDPIVSANVRSYTNEISYIRCNCLCDCKISYWSILDINCGSSNLDICLITSCFFIMSTRSSITVDGNNKPSTFPIFIVLTKCFG